MEQNKLDKLFQEKFLDLSAKPSAHVWKTIEIDLQRKKTKRRGFWLKFSVVTLIFSFLMFLVVYNNFQKQDTIYPNVIIEKSIVTKDRVLNKLEKESSKTLKNNSNGIKEDSLQKRKNVSKKPKKHSFILKKKKEDSIKNTKQFLFQKKKKDSLKKIVKNSKEKERYKHIEKVFVKLKKEKESHQKKGQKKKKEEIAIKNIKKVKEPLVNKMFTPVFSIISNGVFSNKNPLDSKLKETITRGNFTFSYGIRGEISLQKNSRIQFGVFRKKLKYTTTNVAYVSGVSGDKLENIAYKTSSLFIHVESSNSFDINNFTLSSNSTSSTNAQLIQEYSYIEIPVEYLYKKEYFTKIDTYYIAGISALFLTKNTVSINATNFSKVLGKANNINTLNFSTNVGVKFEYLLGNHWKFNVSPMFKVYLHTFSKNSNGFNPYSFGVYSGIKYEF